VLYSAFGSYSAYLTLRKLCLEFMGFGHYSCY